MVHFDRMSLRLDFWLFVGFDLVRIKNNLHKNNIEIYKKNINTQFITKYEKRWL